LIVLNEFQSVADIDCGIRKGLDDSFHDLIYISSLMGRIEYGILVHLRNPLNFFFGSIFLKEILVFYHDSILIFKLELTLIAKGRKREIIESSFNFNDLSHSKSTNILPRN